MTEYRPARTTKERRLEIGLFIRKRIRRGPRRQSAVTQSNPITHPISPSSPSEVPAPESARPPAMAFSARSSEDGGTRRGSEEPTPSTYAVRGEDDPGPIEGASFELGGFASLATETDTDAG